MIKAEEAHSKSNTAYHNLKEKSKKLFEEKYSKSLSDLSFKIESAAKKGKYCIKDARIVLSESAADFFVNYMEELGYTFGVSVYSLCDSRKLNRTGKESFSVNCFENLEEYFFDLYW